MRIALALGGVLVMAIAASVAAILLGGGAPVRSAAARHEVGRVKSTTPSIANQLAQAAVDLAAASGDSKVSSVTWVVSTRGRAALVFGGDATTDSLPVFVLEMSGHFYSQGSVPIGEWPGAYPYMIVALEQSDFGVTDERWTGDYQNLALLGSPQMDTLKGRSPNGKGPVLIP